MTAYVVRRILYAVPLLLGIMVFTFVLFFVVNPPDRMARMMLGEKNVTPEQVENWLRDHEYHLPLLLNSGAGGIGVVTETIFFTKSASLLWFSFGTSDRNNVDIGAQILRRMGPSLAITIPTFALTLLVSLTLAMLIAFARATYFDRWALVLTVGMMSVSMLFYIIGGQWFLAKMLRLFPVSGFDGGLGALKFVQLPILIGIIGGIGASARFYRTVYLEELGKDYIRTARAKGLGESAVLFKHGLKNIMLPVLTNTIVVIPLLFTGSLLLESFFAIPALGSFMIEAIHAQDLAIIRAMVYLGAFLYVIALIVTDVTYTIVDPRVRLR